MYRTTFSWHIEDMDRLGINVVHYGAAKTWYYVPPHYALEVEELVKKKYPKYLTKKCLAFRLDLT